MGVLIELDRTGDTPTFWDKTQAAIERAKAKFDELKAKGYLLFQVGEHEDEATCDKCNGTGKVKVATANGKHMREYNSKACQIVAAPRTAGG